MDESAGHTSTAAAAEPAHVAVIIPAYRDTAAVADAVSALRASLAVKLDIVVVNNEPADSLSHLSSPSSNVTVRIIEAGFNSGFTGAVNRGIAATTAPWVFMHNQDMLVSEHHLTELVSLSSSSTSTPSLRHMICPIDIDDGDESDEPWIKLSEHIPAILSHALAILQVRHLPLSLRYVTIKSYPYQPYHIILHSNILKYITPHQIIRCQVTLYHPISYKSHRT